ncbi:MAG: hypothetical protein ABI780_14195 [Ardenticatenales bacterium]
MHRPSSPFRTLVTLLAVTVLSAAAAAGLAVGTARAESARSATRSINAIAAIAVDPVPMRADGRLGAFVTVADACSYYPLTMCDGQILNVSESSDVSLAHYVGMEVHLELASRVCGTSIAGRPLDGPVAVGVQIVGPCGPPLTARPCPKLAGRVPAAVIQAALAEPGRVLGWGDLCNSAVPFGPLNPRRTSLTLLNPGVPYHPTLNSVVFKCGCP